MKATSVINVLLRGLSLAVRKSNQTKRIDQAEKRRRISIIKGLKAGPEKDRLLMELLEEE